MPKTATQYLYAALMLAATVFIVVGGLVFYGTVSFEGYIGGLLFFALAAAIFLCARELKPKEAEAKVRGMRGHLGARKLIERRIEPR